VVRHTATVRSIELTKQDEEDLAADFFLTLINDDFAVLRRFRGESSLATYLTVVARRVVVRDLLRRKTSANLDSAIAAAVAGHEAPEQRMSDREEVERLLQTLSGREAEIVRLYHLDEKSYNEISKLVGVPENTIGPTLSRARAKMRTAVGESPA
jgi:RNA polymerase sigma-70 factor (ECF subfamily)